MIDNSRDDEIKHVARIRLAGILLDEKSYDEGLKLLEAAARPPHFEALYADRRGDLLLAQGKAADARTAWQDALAKADAKAAIRGSLQLKLDLAATVASVAAPAALSAVVPAGAPATASTATTGAAPPASTPAAPAAVSK